MCGTVQLANIRNSQNDWIMVLFLPEEYNDSYLFISISKWWQSELGGDLVTTLKVHLETTGIMRGYILHATGVLFIVHVCTDGVYTTLSHSSTTVRY